jgi:hypothetical protein
MSSIRFRQIDDGAWVVSFRLDDPILPEQMSDLYDLHAISDLISDATSDEQLVQHVRFRVQGDDVFRVMKQARWLLTYH